MEASVPGVRYVYDGDPQQIELRDQAAVGRAAHWAGRIVGAAGEQQVEVFFPPTIPGEVAASNVAHMLGAQEAEFRPYDYQQAA